MLIVRAEQGRGLERAACLCPQDFRPTNVIRIVPGAVEKNQSMVTASRERQVSRKIYGNCMVFNSIIHDPILKQRNLPILSHSAIIRNTAELFHEPTLLFNFNSPHLVPDLQPACVRVGILPCKPHVCAKSYIVQRTVGSCRP